MQSIPMTVRGAKLLRDELNELKTVTRPKIVSVLVLSALSAILFDQTVVYCANHVIERLTKWVQGVFTTHRSQ